MIVRSHLQIQKYYRKKAIPHDYLILWESNVPMGSQGNKSKLRFLTKLDAGASYQEDK